MLKIFVGDSKTIIRPSRELFIYGPLKSLESKTSETENIAVF